MTKIPNSYRNTTPSRIQERMANPETRGETLNELGLWVTETAMMFGCEAETALSAAALFVRGLRKEWEEVEE